MNLVLSSTSLEGNDIKNSAGEDLGKLEDIMLDTENGRIAYGVVSFGGFLGLGDKLFAVPWSAFDVDTSEKCLRLEVDKQRMEQAEGFDKDDWPDFANRAWATKVYDFYNQPVYLT